MEYGIIALMWVVYCVLHSYLISIRFSGFLSRVLGRYYAFYRMFYVLVSMVLLFPLWVYTVRVESETIVTYGVYLNIVRYALIGASLAVFFWTLLISYDPLYFLGVRQIMNLATNQTNKAVEISKKGLLGMVRHPMYMALIVYLWCQTTREIDAIVSAILTVYVIVGTKLEERKLVLEFGDAYVKYQKEVPMLVPFTKRTRGNSR